MFHAQRGGNLRPLGRRDRQWILNVGDIKPGEIKLDLFAKLAWDVEGHDDTPPPTEHCAPM
ncbi:glycosyl hydrolase 115 family protein [Micromonospora musae]